MKRLVQTISIAALSCIVVAVAACKKETTSSNNNNNPPHDTIAYYNWTQFVMGADLSYVNHIEEYGAVYKDSGLVKDPFTIFKNHGANVVRIRLWHNPQWLAPLNSGKIYSDLYDVEKTIRRAKAAGMAVNLDIHYSDRWADPANQNTPAAWSGLSLNVLKDSVYQYTLRVLNYYKSKNLTPEMVQVGNETNQGMLWNAGKVIANNFVPFGELLNSGIKAVRDFSLTSAIKPQIILHVAQFQSANYFTNGVINGGGVTDFDILGVSHYFNYSTLPTMAAVGDTIRAVKSRYNKKVMIVETAYPWTSANADSYSNITPGTGFSGYGVSPQEQYRYMRDLAQTVITAGGSGIMYWEPAWITSNMHDERGTGSSWDNVTFFDFSGNTLPAIDWMRYKYSF